MYQEGAERHWQPSLRATVPPAIYAGIRTRVFLVKNSGKPLLDSSFLLKKGKYHEK